MATNRRPIDKYTQRRRAELAARRKAAQPAPVRRQPRPKPAPAVLPPPAPLPQHCRYARELLPVFARLRPRAKQRVIRTLWTDAHDLALLRAYAANLPAPQVAAEVRPVRPGVTPGACARRIRELWVMYGPGVPA